MIPRFSSIKIPACERCRKSKIKCDVAIPKCSACTKGSTACIIVDSSTGDRYGREQLHEMQQTLERLELKKRQANIAAPQSAGSPPSPSARRTPYVGDGSGIDMFHRVSASANTAEARAKVLEQLNQQSPRNELSIPGHDLPSFELAGQLVDRYLGHAHFLHPLLSKQHVRSTFDRVYSSYQSNADNQDLYHIFMISAISSVTMFRRGLISEHPFGFYRSASRLIPFIPLMGSVQGIQNLLLIARFAMYYHIECSIWDISRLCMRQCVELGLHLAPTTAIPAMDEQLHRNVFWDCYVHDRYSSGILGRPFAISDQEIEVELPIEADEDQILLSGCQSLDQIRLEQLSIPNEASIFQFIIQLRRLTSRCQARFFSPRVMSRPRSDTILSAGEVSRDLKSFLKELDHCQQCAPCFSQPSTLYERPEWHHFMVEKDRLTLVRGAFASLQICGSHLPRKLLVMCLKCATRIIELYFGLFAAGAITWTRSYFQILFTSGLSIMYAISQLKASTNENQPPDDLERSSQALARCCELLSKFVSEMPDARRFAVVFEALSKQYIHREQYNSSQLTANQSQYPQTTMVPDDLDTFVSHNGVHAAQDFSSTSNDIGQDNVQQDDTGFDLDLSNLDDWLLFSTGSETFLGQMEAGIGQYAWGTMHDASAWEHHFAS